MNSLPTSPLPDPLRRTGYTVLLIEGILLVVLGIFALAVPFVAGLFTAGMIGWLLVITGIAGLVSTFSSRPHLHFWGGLLSSVATLLIGVIVVLNPAPSAVALAWLIAAWLMMDGVSSIMIALTARRADTPNWWWLILSGVVDWVLALLIAFSNFAVGIVLVGTLIGVDLVFGGVALLGLARSLRKNTL